MDGFYYKGLGREEKAAYEQMKTGFEQLMPAVRVIRLERERLAEVFSGEARLIISRFDAEETLAVCGSADLDSVIDAAGIRLAGIVPEDGLLAMHGSCRELLQRKSHGFSAIERIAARLEGEAVPLGSLRRF